MRVTNQESDNLYADMILKVLGAKSRGDGSFAGGVAAVRDVMRELGVPAAGYAAVDGSGLARDSKLSAAAIVALLEAMDRHPLGPVYKDSLAIGGRDGTLRKRFREPQVAGRVHAKTGSLDGVSALSGYVDSVSGEPFAFATLVNSEKGDRRRETRTGSSASWPGSRRDEWESRSRRRARPRRRHRGRPARG